MLHSYLDATASSSMPPLIHREKGTQGAGFGAVMQERANMLLLGIATGRRVLYLTQDGTFNAGGGLISPAGTPSTPRTGVPADAGYDDMASCMEAARSMVPTCRGL